MTCIVQPIEEKPKSVNELRPGSKKYHDISNYVKILRKKGENNRNVRRAVKRKFDVELILD